MRLVGIADKEKFVDGPPSRAKTIVVSMKLRAGMIAETGTGQPWA